MTINPDIALAYLRELSADYRAGIVLNTHGERLAGDVRLTAAARALVAANARGESETGAREEDGAGGAARMFEGSAEAGKVFGATTEALSIVVVTGRLALPSVAIRDLRTVLAGMGVQTAQGTAVQRIPHGCVAHVLAAAR